MADVEIPQPHEVKETAENPFTRFVALAVAVYAVGMAVGSFGGQNATKEMMLCKQDETLAENTAQQLEFNAWGQYQSKSTRETVFKSERMKLQAEERANPAAFPAYKKELLQQFTEEENRMGADKSKLDADAKRLKDEGHQKVRAIQERLNRAERKDPYFDFAEVFFQLAIVFASVAMLAEKRWAFALSVVMFVVAMVLTLNGFTLLVAIPGLDDGPK